MCQVPAGFVLFQVGKQSCAHGLYAAACAPQSCLVFVLTGAVAAFHDGAVRQLYGPGEFFGGEALLLDSRLLAQSPCVHAEQLRVTVAGEDLTARLLSSRGSEGI